MHARRTLVVLTAALALTFASRAGPLDPPVGPVAPSFKTLTETEPRIAVNATNTPGNATSLFRITQAGSYYLTGNITGVIGKNGIEITTPGVSLDLMGFDMNGTGSGTLTGVLATGVSTYSISVSNGSIRNWGGFGVNLSVAFNVRLSDLVLTQNLSGGVTTGSSAIITRCLAWGNLSGFAVSGVGHISDCVADTNTNVGFEVQTGDISRCSCNSTGSHGIQGLTSCTVTDCYVTNSLASGVVLNSQSVISNCSITVCSLDGIVAGGGCTIRGCTVGGNTGDGIRCTTRCHVFANACLGNGAGGGSGAGIHATGSDNRIEGNNCTGADRGIDVDVAGNIIIRNTCSGNTTNWDIAANNMYGPIIDRTAPASPAVTGNSAASALGSTDPNANFTY